MDNQNTQLDKFARRVEMARQTTIADDVLKWANVFFGREASLNEVHIAYKTACKDMDTLELMGVDTGDGIELLNEAMGGMFESNERQDKYWLEVCELVDPKDESKGTQTYANLTTRELGCAIENAKTREDRIVDIWSNVDGVPQPIGKITMYDMTI